MNSMQRSSDTTPSNTLTDATLIGWPSRSKYRKRASPEESELWLRISAMKGAFRILGAIRPIFLGGRPAVV